VIFLSLVGEKTELNNKDETIYTYQQILDAALMKYLLHQERLIKVVLLHLMIFDFGEFLSEHTVLFALFYQSLT
jgi:hypothetical protein